MLDVGFCPWVAASRCRFLDEYVLVICFVCCFVVIHNVTSMLCMCTVCMSASRVDKHVTEPSLAQEVNSCGGAEYSLKIFRHMKQPLSCSLYLSSVSISRI